MARLQSAFFDVMIGVAVLFICGALYFAIGLSHKNYPPTAAQQVYAARFCVAQQHGVVADVHVNKPDLFGTSGSAPKLSIRCAFGSKNFMLKTVDLASANAVPR